MSLKKLLLDAINDDPEFANYITGIIRFGEELYGVVLNEDVVEILTENTEESVKFQIKVVDKTRQLYYSVVLLSPEELGAHNLALFYEFPDKFLSYYTSYEVDIQALADEIVEAVRDCMFKLRVSDFIVLEKTFPGLIDEITKREIVLDILDFREFIILNQERNEREVQ